MNDYRFPMRKLALLVAACYAPGVIAAQAARIEFSTGEPVVLSADGRERPARKGEAIVAGERVLTRAGRAQLAFADGAFVSLQPNTDFGVTEYNFNGKTDGSEKSVLSLVKGALRTVTGLIGRSKRDAYVMHTPSATIGIRGTGGRIEVNEQGTFVAGTSGTWFIRTQGGSIDIPPGGIGFARPNSEVPPELTNLQPNTPPVGPVLSGFVAPEQVNSSGGSASVPPAVAMADGPGYAVLHASSLDGLTADVASTTATFAGGAKLLSFVDAVANPVNSGTTVIYESGNDGLIGWGRWKAGDYYVNAVPQTLNGDQSLHYVVGVPTATMPNTGVANYSFVAATSPTLTDGTAAGTIVQANTTLQVNLAGISTAVNFSIAANVGGYVYGLAGTGVTVSGGIASQTYSGVNPGGWATACAGACGCDGSIKVLFTGTNAERAGVIYSITGDAAPNTVNGAIVFKQ